MILKTPKSLGSNIAVRHAVNSLLPGSPQGKEGFTMTKKTFIERVGADYLCARVGLDTCKSQVPASEL